MSKEVLEDRIKLLFEELMRDVPLEYQMYFLEMIPYIREFILNEIEKNEK